MCFCAVKDGSKNVRGGVGGEAVESRPNRKNWDHVQMEKKKETKMSRSKRFKVVGSQELPKSFFLVVLWKNMHKG